MNNMAVLKLGKGERFVKKGSKVTELFWIVQGSVQQILKNEDILIEKGNIIGLAEKVNEIFPYDYVTNEECVIYSYPYENEEDLMKTFSAQPKNAPIFAMSAARGANRALQRYMDYLTLSKNLYLVSNELYRQYKIICNKLKIEPKEFSKIDYFEPMELEHTITKSKIDYFNALSKLSLEDIQNFYGKNDALILGEMTFAGECMEQGISMFEDMKQYLLDYQDILLSDNKDDLFGLYFDLMKRAAARGLDTKLFQDKLKYIMDFVQRSKLYEKDLIENRVAEYESYDFSKVSEKDLENIQEEEEELEEPPLGDGWFTYILRYASYDEEKEKRAKKLVEDYSELTDFYSTADDVRKLRRDLTKMFYDVYVRVFKRSVSRKNVPTIIKMFLNFGFMDVKLVGEENASELYKLAEQVEEKCNDANVYTAYEWLKSIYEGKNEPSKNEFDLDYEGYLREQKRMGEITAAQAAAFVNDNWNKTIYEIDNMFKSTNRATYGKFLTFQPILCNEDIINSLDTMLVTVDKIHDAIEYMRSIDYSLFYHDVLFTDPDHGITKDVLKKEIYPYVILMPNAGNRSMMWQETAGSKRDTPARFILPILTISDINELMIELCARYRWELCRRIQGMRWNDITEPSLTSEYCDYMQFYRKNHDLSSEAKEKIKNMLVKAKNNYREVFVKDYQNWIKFEAKGSFRLNKVSREILFKYCPFAKSIRTKLMVNPMYQNMFEKFEIFKGRELRHINNVYDKYQKSGGVLTEEMQANLDFYDL